MQQDSESDGPIPKQRVVSAMTHRALCPLDSDAGIIKLCPSPSCQADIERSALSSPRVKILMAPKPSFVASDRSHGGSRSDNHLGFQLYSVNTDSTSSGKEASGLCNSFIRTGQGGGEASSTSISFLNHPGLGKDPKAAREALHEAFPESLFYITVDDMAAEAVAQGETAIVSDCGFHRQFTEQMLLDIYELIVSTSNLAEERQRFLMCSSQLEVGEADMKAYTRAATDESMRELSIYDDVWYLPSIDSDNGVLTAVIGTLFSGANTIMSTRSRRGRTTTRQPLGDEIYLRFTNPKLYAWVMQHSPQTLTFSTNIIREYLQFSQRIAFREKINRMLQATRIVQRFFRICLNRKKRAVRRMLRQWQQLEVECRMRLKKQTFGSAQMDRIDFVVSSVLWEHVVTTDDYKLKLLKELYSARRAAYFRWSAQRREEEGSNLKNARAARALSFSSEGSTAEAASFASGDTVAAGEDCEARLQERHKADNTGHVCSAWITRWRDVVHTRFGWYIDPEELLIESHRRLLISLRTTILKMKDVQAELKRRGAEETVPLL
uniref:Uncharacterized protein n=1 Tax=Trypanosoma vivax (strain Y486) TaxID=1055687 RepID=G0U869_TRYVY|nr:conserved hypothetical protein, fragment [Trypanosoma vivax Y486]